jgi:hypothetical protein
MTGTFSYRWEKFRYEISDIQKENPAAEVKWKKSHDFSTTIFNTVTDWDEINSFLKLICFKSLNLLWKITIFSRFII